MDKGRTVHVPRATASSAGPRQPPRVDERAAGACCLGHRQSCLTATVAPPPQPSNLARDRKPVVGNERGDHSHAERGDRAPSRVPVAIQARAS